MSPDPEQLRHQRVRALFHDAVETSPADRERLLSELEISAADDAAELRSLLAAHDAAGDFVTDGIAQHNREIERDVGASLVGQRLGAYRLERLLGRGGMGAVYLGRRADDAFRQDVAIKLLRPELVSPELVARFRGERQALASLNHPNIARLLDGGATEEGLPYLVMEYVSGVPLEEHCDAKRLGLEARLDLFASVCGAVEEAHRNLIVHRDIKPANILVTDGGTVKLLDFGLAKLLESGQDATQRLTETARYGTLPFASPEQLSGGTITTGTDVYALGVLLYRLLTGRHPYDLQGKTPVQALKVVCEEAPHSPSRVVLGTPPDWAPEGRRLSRALSGDIDQVILKALRKEPARRYGSVGALAEDVRRHRAGLPVAARPDAVGYLVGKFVMRHRAAVAAAALSLLALVGGLAAYVRQARRAEVERSKAEQVSAFLGRTLSSADPVRGDGRKVTIVEVLDRSSARLERELAGQPEVETSLRETLGETYLNLGLPREAEREYLRALQLHPARPASFHAHLGHALSDQGRWSDARAEVKRALELCKGLPKPSLACVDALDVLMVTLQNEGRMKEAAAAGREALSALRRDFPAEKATLASVLNNLGMCLGNQGELREAEALHREAVEAARAAHGERHPMTAEAVANLAGVLDMQSRWTEAEPLFRKALEVQEDVIGERHFDFIRTLTSYANMLDLAKRAPEAEPHARRAQALAVSALGPAHPLAAYAENILGGVLLEVGKGAEAEGHIRAALEARRKAFPKGHWLIASAQSNLGAALLAQRRFGDAERELEEAYAALLAGPGPKHEKALLTANRLAALYEATGRNAEARRYREASTAAPPR